MSDTRVGGRPGETATHPAISSLLVTIERVAAMENPPAPGRADE
ncbi:hypothetical protein ACFQ73_40405 [Amycolatopsis japonica]